MDGERNTPARDTIVAPSTAPGRAALAVIRLSGPAVSTVVSRVFRRSPPSPLPPRRPVLGTFVDEEGQPLDTGLATFFPGPQSYTGEDVAELSCHGSPAIVEALVEACVRAGARPAEPGEFTLRAFERGKLDLAQAEAVADLVAAQSVEQARVAARQVRGEVGSAFRPLAEELVDLLADVEAGLDFSEEERDLAEPPARLARRCAELVERIDRLLAASEAARRVREGARVVLSGPENAGKSSIFNYLAGFPRVIVTDEPGTTRDLVEEVISIEGLPVVLVDGAGSGAPRGRADELGRQRARQAARTAHLVLDVYDRRAAYRPPQEADGSRLPVATHADLTGGREPSPGSIVVSSKTGQGFEALKREIARRLRAPGGRPVESVALATARHRAAALEARDHLEAARRTLSEGGETELAAADLRAAVQRVRSILGEVGPEEILGRIFSRFCIGK